MMMESNENTKLVETHGCIVCARLFNILCVYNRDGKLVDCTVTGTGGHIVHDENHPLVACNIHSEETIEQAYKRWLNKA